MIITKRACSNRSTMVAIPTPCKIKDTSSSNWFEMPPPTMTPELQKDLQLLNLRNVVDPKRHYKKGCRNALVNLFFYIIDKSPLYSSGGNSGRVITKKERKQTVAEEFLSDPALQTYRKRKVHEIEEKNRPADNEKWKNKGKMSYKSAKQRRH